MSHPAKTPSVPMLMLGLLLFDGLHFVWARILREYLPPMASVPLYFLIATVQIGSFAWWQGKLRWQTFRRLWWFFLAVGACIAFSTSTNYFAVSYIDPGTGTLLTQSIIVYNLAFGVIWFKDRLTRPQLLGAALCILGILIISFQPGDYLRVGTLMVLTSTLFYSFHAALVKRYGNDMDFLDFFTWRIASTTLWSMLATTAMGQWQWPSGAAWLWLLAAATFDIVISRALYYLALRRLSISLHTISLTLSPVMATLWSLILFNVVPSLRQVIGGMAILAGIAVVSLARRSR
ncbi:MAG: DMT family transporter [Anaerolineae bacterium]|nr:DMT family transporter [Anaerolineae bacterium]